nr:MAG TPA: Protein of unknown function (DUF2577) [Caudoviricetes sp.]
MELSEVIHQLIGQSIDFNKFTDIYYGDVVGVDPLKIKINNVITLEEENLILTRNVIDHEIDITVQWETVKKNIPKTDKHTHKVQTISSGSAFPSDDIDTTHLHPIKGKKKIIVHNKLKKNEKVLLIKAYGGQKYVVLDRISKYKTEGEWKK